MKKIVCFLLLNAACSLVSASVITHTFSGEIAFGGFITEYEFVQAPTAFEEGNLITGTFSYDTTSPATDAVSNLANYAALVDFSLTIGEFTLSSDNSNGNSRISIANDVSRNGDPLDWFKVHGALIKAEDVYSIFSYNLIAGFSLNLEDGLGAVFSDTSLPTTPFTINDFSPENARSKSWGTIQFNFDPVYTPGFGDSFGALSFIVTDVTPVPVPASIWLLSSALIGLMSVRKKQS